MLVWSRSGRWSAWGVAALLLGVFYILPLAVIALASLAGQWNGAQGRLQPTPSLSQGSGLNAVSCTSASACTAVGRSGAGPLAERWNGARWSVQATQDPPSRFSSLAGVSCASGATCTAVGVYDPRQDHGALLAEQDTH